MPRPISIPESLIKSIFGATPAVKPTTLQGSSSPVSSIITALTLPFSSATISFKFVESRKSIPLLKISRLIILLSPSGSTPFQKLSSLTKNVTGIWRECSISAISIPINPPPTITARLHTLLSGAYFSRFSKSCLWYMPITPSKS